MVVAVAGILGTLIGTVVTGLLAFWREQKTQRRRESHETRLQRQNLDSERHRWLSNERRVAYAHMASLTVTVDPNEPYSLQDLSEVFSEIEMLSESEAVVESAWQLHGVQFRTRKKAREVAKLDEDPAQDAEFQEIHREKEARRKSFIRHAKAELGLEVRSGDSI